MDVWDDGGSRQNSGPTDSSVSIPRVGVLSGRFDSMNLPLSIVIMIKVILFSVFDLDKVVWSCIPVGFLFP